MRHVTRSTLAAAFLVGILAPTAPAHLGSGAQCTFIDTSIRASGMGKTGVSVLWGEVPDDCAAPTLSGYRKGVGYERGKNQLVPGLANDVFIKSDHVSIAAYVGEIVITEMPVTGVGGSLASASQERAELALPATSTTYKSPRKATRLSLLCTAVPVAAGIGYWLGQNWSTGSGRYDAQRRIVEYKGDPDRLIPSIIIGTGLMFGPSAGHVYARRLGLLPVRIGVTGAATALAFTTATSRSGGWDGHAISVGILAVGGGIAVVTSAIDIAKADGATRKYNDKQSEAQVSLIPSVLGGEKSPGLMVAASF